MKKSSHEKKENKATERREKHGKTESEYRKSMMSSNVSHYKKRS